MSPKSKVPEPKARKPETVFESFSKWIGPNLLELPKTRETVNASYTILLLTKIMQAVLQGNPMAATVLTHMLEQPVSEDWESDK